jgi:hypothetical protein
MRNNLDDFHDEDNCALTTCGSWRANTVITIIGIFTAATGLVGVSECQRQIRIIADGGTGKSWDGWDGWDG